MPQWREALQCITLCRIADVALCFLSSSLQALSIPGDFTSSQLTLSTPTPSNKVEAVVVMTTKTSPSQSWVLAFKGSTPAKAIPFDAHLVLLADNTFVTLRKEDEVLKVEVFSRGSGERVRKLANDVTLPQSAGQPVKVCTYVYDHDVIGETEVLML